MSTLAPLLQAFFTERLIGQRDASPHTVASYRDAICLLLRFALGRAETPSTMVRLVRGEGAMPALWRMVQTVEAPIR
jgi:hypothetical protein